MNLAMIQMRVSGGQREENLRRAEGLVAEAARHGAHVALLPEAMDLGWTHSSAKTQAEPIPEGITCRMLRELARKHNLYLCSGLIEAAGDRVYNSAILIDPAGTIRVHHRKINELDIAHHLYSLGDRLGVTETPWGRIGVHICADAFAPGQVISRALGLMGAKVILSPCSWAVPADHDQQKEPYGKLWLDNYAPVAKAFGLWIVGVSNVGPISDGPWNGRKCIGCSLAVGPEGKPLAMAPYGEEAEGIVYVEVGG